MIINERGEPAMKTKQYTILDGDRRFKQIEWGSAPLPKCQGSHWAPYTYCPNPGEFDSPTNDGPWADLCRHHAEQICPKGSTIGYHRIKAGS